jgi:catechol 2,3-dioxygenase-like lactoylglutathione lyase family enzyme
VHRDRGTKPSSDIGRRGTARKDFRKLSERSKPIRPWIESEEANMLGKTNATANIAVKDLPSAKKFYEGTLGLTEIDAEGDEVIVMKCGDTLINVYRSQFAGTNKATAVTWAVGDEIDRIVKALKDKGVVFERYDMPGTKLEGDIHVGYGMKVAWFKDPDGNILNLIDQ